MQSMTLIIPGTVYVIYLMLKPCNMCLNIILRELYVETRENPSQFLKINGC